MTEDIKAQLDRIENMLAVAASQKDVLTIDEVVVLTGYSKQRIYGLCSQRKIPHYKNGEGSKLYFRRKELEAWMTARRVPTQAEIDSKTAMYCHTHSN